MKLIITFLFLSLCIFVIADKLEKYSDDLKTNDYDLRNLKTPYRIAKLNLLWSKAVHRLQEQKLKSLFTELKIHDKEELAYKHLKNGKPKDTNTDIREIDLRRKLIGIMSTYGLLEVVDEKDLNNPELYKHHNPMEGKVKEVIYKNKALFKDKKLNKLWEKVELSGSFSTDELNTLKEEFKNHEDKVNLYYNLIENLDDFKNKKDSDHHKNAIDEEELDAFNEIAIPEDGARDIIQEQNRNKHEQYKSKANQVRDKHREIRDNIDRLERIVSRGSNSSDFIEPKVQQLWRIAQDSNFTAEQLASIKVELYHFQSRFLKLRQMHVEHALSLEKFRHGDKHYDKVDEIEAKIKQHSKKVEKLHVDLEKRLRIHSEL